MGLTAAVPSTRIFQPMQRSSRRPFVAQYYVEFARRGQRVFTSKRGLKAFMQPAGDTCNPGAAATQGSISSEVVLQRLSAEPKYAQLLDDLPNYTAAVDLHLLLHDMVGQQAALQPAPTMVSDAQGVLLKHVVAGEYTGWPNMVQTFQAPAPIDWMHHNFAVVPAFGYSKSSVFTADDCLTPHLELETGVAGDGSKILLYLNMDPRLSLELHPAYLEHYYSTAPPGSSSSSWRALEARAAATPGFTRFVSTSLHVRVFSACSILFWVACEPDALDAARRVVADGVGIWLSWLAAGGTNSAASSAAVEAAAGPDAVPQEDAHRHKLLSDMAAFSAAWRNFPRREAASGRMIEAFGAPAMEAVYNSMAGSASVRLPAR